MSKVIALGNGFDLGLGLPTRYSDFIASRTFHIHKSYNKLFGHFLSVQDAEGWVDFEQEIYKYSLTDPEPEEFKKELQKLCDVFYKYLADISLYNNINTKSKAFNFLRNHLYSSIDRPLCIINFNFTDCVNWIFDYLRDNEHGFDNTKFQVIHVHGSIKAKDLIFGVDDQADVLEQYHFIKKSANRNFKPSNVHHFLKIASSLECYGLSFGLSDHTYFSEYILNHLEESDPQKTFQVFNVERAFDSIHFQLGELTNKNLTKLRASPRYSFHSVD